MYQSGTVELENIVSNPQTTDKVTDMLFDKATTAFGLIYERIDVFVGLAMDSIQKILQDSLKDSNHGEL
jgi:hypothetical protein